MSIVSNILATLTPLMIQAGEQGENAGAAPAQGASPDAVQVQSIWDFIEKGGIMMIPLGICSLIMIAVVIERLIVLRKKNIIPPGFLKDLEREVERAPEDNKAALEFCNRNGSTLAAICAAGLKRRGMSLELIERHVADAGEREVFKLRKYLRSLAVIAAIAPLMGLTGTIFGMIKAFQTVAVSADALGKTEMLATGIYEAMITTAAGLLVAIPALICYHFISALIEKRVAEMDALIVDFIEEHVGLTGARPAGIDVKSNGREVKEPAQKPSTAAPAGAGAAGTA